jgi:hypothetical protein
MAELLVSERLKTIKNTKTKLVSPKAQDISPITNQENVLIESIKYGSKILTEQDIKKLKKETEKYT